MIAGLHRSLMLRALVAAILTMGITATAVAQDYSSHMARGARLAKARQYTKALEAFRQALKADPSQMDAHFNVGNIAGHLGDCRSAIVHLRAFLYLASGGTGDSVKGDIRTAEDTLRQCEARKKTGRASLRSDPPGIEVMLDNTLIGRTPLIEVPLSPGRYRATFRHPDFDEQAVDVEVTAGPDAADKTMVMVRKRMIGFLEVRTDPPDGVRVLLDERELGTTPLGRQELETRKYLVKFAKPGYSDWVRYVTIQRDRVQVVSAVLEPEVPPLPDR